MCTTSCIVFGVCHLSPAEVAGRRVIEVGSYDLNGSLRPVVEQWGPAQYLGVDIQEGPGVDLVCPAEEVAERLGEGGFDIVISTEMLEHVRDWRRVISNLKRLCKPEGILLVTTRSFGFGYHAYPYDFWRFEPEDMARIFADFQIEALERDWLKPGVFLRARRPRDWQEKDCSDIELYSMVHQHRARDITDADLQRFLQEMERQRREAQRIKCPYLRLRDLGSRIVRRLIREIRGALK